MPPGKTSLAPLNRASADALEDEMTVGEIAEENHYADAIIGIYCDSRERVWG